LSEQRIGFKILLLSIPLKLLIKQTKKQRKNRGRGAFCQSQEQREEKVGLVKDHNFMKFLRIP